MSIFWILQEHNGNLKYYTVLQSHFKSGITLQLFLSKQKKGGSSNHIDRENGPES
jgi:hypothetical protein